ncbi:MAG: hypothetical protein R3188_07240 [Acidiferrobacterales bacterium]|nr:hypothetical protein [Acidiferrobacterales bacterium]
MVNKTCVLCSSDYFITFHHLIPKSCHRNKWFRKNFSKDEMTGRDIDICRRCHSFLHKKFPEKVLGRELNTLEKILTNEIVRTYLKWAEKNAHRYA